MSRLTNRSEHLYRKTHRYVSPKDLRLLMNYWKARLDEANVKPTDFKEAFDELKRILKKMEASGDRRALDTFHEKNHLAYCAFMYTGATKHFEAFPEGSWLPRKGYDGYWQTLEIARREEKNRNG